MRGGVVESRPTRWLVAPFPLESRPADLRTPAQMFALLFDLGDYATTYRATRDAYLKAANGM
jgi:hypothetical protein